jgi:GDP-4-dehydro-6-deoxy-D-mannose reductase
MKYLVTGITGFAGPHLAKLLLKKGHEVHGVIRSPNGRDADLLDVLSLDEHKSITFHCLDLKHYHGVDKLLKSEKFDGIFHLAAQSHPPTGFKDPILTFNDNVMASMNLITSLEKSDTKFMFCSTSEVYGDTCKDKGLLKTTDVLSPSNPYGASKAAIDLYMQERMNNEYLNGFVTRAFAHTGPRRGYNFSISSDAFQIAKMKLGLQEKILQIGNLQTERVVIDVRDCVNAYYLLMATEESSGKVFNVCGDAKNVHKMEYFTNLLIQSAGFEEWEITKKVNPKFCRPIDIQIQIGDSKELRDITNWDTTIPIEKTMDDLITYWSDKVRG